MHKSSQTKNWVWWPKPITINTKWNLKNTENIRKENLKIMDNQGKPISPILVWTKFSISLRHFRKHPSIGLQEPFSAQWNKIFPNFKEQEATIYNTQCIYTQGFENAKPVEEKLKEESKKTSTMAHLVTDLKEKPISCGFFLVDFC